MTHDTGHYDKHNRSHRWGIDWHAIGMDLGVTERETPSGWVGRWIDYQDHWLDIDDHEEYRLQIVTDLEADQRLDDHEQ